MSQELVQKQFGANAEAYVSSQVHAQGHSLARMAELADAQPHWLALDVAPGGGHSALVIAPHVRRMVSIDITFPMLQAARRNGEKQGVALVGWVQGRGEMLPFPSVFDLLTCRVALHHFPDQPAAIRDWARVLKPGGRLVLVDNIGPDEPDAVRYVNQFETIRDPSHGWMYPLAELAGFVAQAGLVVEHVEQLVKPMQFFPWMARMQVNAEDRARLTDMLWQSEGPARDFLNPQGQGEETTFSLREGVIRARKPD
ncbi:MAG: class I SAM-dependent methyltransferase [Caldilineales bacterium]|nr:class I SAM-dependent methyltransferase [Caldilineales bacterium]